MKKVKTWIVVIIVLMIVVAALKIGFQHQRMQPKINVAPKVFITLHGTVDKYIKYLGFEVTYFTYNKACQYYSSWIEGAVADRDKEFYYPVQIEKDGRYKIKLPLDKLEKGYCDWRLYQINYLVNNKDTKRGAISMAALRFSQYASKLTEPLSMNIRCVTDHKINVELACDFGKSNFEPLGVSKYTKDVTINFIKVNYIVPLAIIKKNLIEGR